jgi:hypothetical protein
MGVDLVWVKGQAGGRHAGAAVAVKPGGRKQFFFEKKNQKTFASLGRASPERPKPNVQKFFASFFKKEDLSSALLLPSATFLVATGACRT